MNNFFQEPQDEKIILNKFLSDKEFYYIEQEHKSKILELESTFKLSLSKNELELYQKIMQEISSLEKLEMLRLIKFVLNDKSKLNDK